MAPGISPAWCNSIAWRSTASPEPCRCAMTAQASPSMRPSALAQALIAPSLGQGFTNRTRKFGRPEIEFTEPCLVYDLAVAADQINPAGPRLVSSLRRAIHAIDDGGKWK